MLHHIRRNLAASSLSSGIAYFAPLHDHEAMLTGTELGRAIEAAIKKKGISKKALADHFGVSPPSIQDWVKRGTISKEKLPKLWRFFQDDVGPEHWGLDRYPVGSISRPFITAEETPPFRLSHDDDDTRLPGETPARTALERRTNVDRRYVGKVALAVMDVVASMGHGASRPSHESVVMNMVVDENWLRRHATFSSPENLSLVTGIGDSMQPTFEDGDPLLVDRGVTDIRLDSIYVLSLKDELYIKRVQRNMDGSLVIISDNPKYRPQEVSDRDRSTFQVLGRVVMAWNSRRI